MLTFDQPQQGGNSRGRSQRQRTGIPKLRTENVSTEKRLTTILAVRNQPDISVCSVKIIHGGEVYLWDLKYSNPNLKRLASLFGDDETTWTDKKFYLATQADEFTGVSFPTVFEQTDEVKPKKRK